MVNRNELQFVAVLKWLNNVEWNLIDKHILRYSIILFIPTTVVN